MWGPCSESTLEHTPNHASLNVAPCNREGMQGAVVLWQSIPRLYTREDSLPILGFFLVLEGNLTRGKLRGRRVHPANRSRLEPVVDGLPIRATLFASCVATRRKINRRTSPHRAYSTLAQRTVGQQHTTRTRLGKLGGSLVLKEDLPRACIVMIDDFPACLILKKSLNSGV